MKLKIDEKDCLLKDLKVPKGYRLIEDWELLRELRTNKKLIDIAKKGIWTNGLSTIRVYYLNYNQYFLADDWGINGDYSAVRGVFTLKNETN